MIRTLLHLYATSWILLLSHALCIVIGAAWAFIAMAGVLRGKGLL